jgi:hypothetical protein
LVVSEFTSRKSSRWSFYTLRDEHIIPITGSTSATHAVNNAEALT